MRLTLDLPIDVSIALRRLAADGRMDLDEAVIMTLRDWLIGHGHIDLEFELDEDTETEGNA